MKINNEFLNIIQDLKAEYCYFQIFICYLVFFYLCLCLYIEFRFKGWVNLNKNLMDIFILNVGRNLSFVKLYDFV